MEGQIPLWLKLAATGVVAVVFAVYARRYPPANFLWASNLGLAGLVLALWLESALLASMMALSLLLPSLMWNVCLVGGLLGARRLREPISYMFDPELPHWLRALSLYHVAVPVLLLWTVVRLGYEPAAVPAQTAVAWTVIGVARVLSGPDVNPNWVYGPTGTIRTPGRSAAWLAALAAFALVVVILPTHLVLGRWL